jgi:hypothetical protein
MFTDEEFNTYFSELEGKYRRTIELYTDLLNQVETLSVRNVFYSLSIENMESFRMVSEQKKKF